MAPLFIVVGYFGSLVVMTTAPLFFDSVTSSTLAIGPLLLDVILSAYVVVHYLRLRGFFRLIVYFFAFEGLLVIPASILAPSGRGQTYPSGSTNYVNSFTNNSTVRWSASLSSCELASGQTSTRDSTGYYGLGYGGADSSITSNCKGFSQLSAEAYSSGIGSKTIIHSSVWFMDRAFFVPDHGQKTTGLVVGGAVFVSGWLANPSAGIGLYEGYTTLDIAVRLTGNAPCDAYDCYSSYSVVESWTGPQSMDSQYQFSGLNFLVDPGYSYTIIVSFNETSNTIGMSPGGVASAEACFGHSSYCLKDPDNFLGPPGCSSIPSQFTPCELELLSLDYAITDY
jgi:hypothetical protein